MYKKLLISAIGLALASQVMAEGYQFEGNLGYTNIKYDFERESDAESDLSAASGVYYFLPVNTDNHPLQEAAFLGKNSSASLLYLNSKVTSESTYVGDSFRIHNESSSKASSFVIAAETYLFGDYFYVGGFVSNAKSEDSYSGKFTDYNSPNLNSTNTSKVKDTDNSWRINLGLAPIDGLLVWSEFEKDVDVGDSWNLNAKYVTEFNSGGALNLQGGVADSAVPSAFNAELYPANMKINFSGFDDDGVRTNSAYILGDYYFNNTVSLGLGVSHVDVDSKYLNVEDSYMIRGKMFFTDTLSVQVGYVNSEDQDMYSLGASLRF